MVEIHHENSKTIVESIRDFRTITKGDTPYSLKPLTRKMNIVSHGVIHVLSLEILTFETRVKSYKNTEDFRKNILDYLETVENHQHTNAKFEKDFLKINVENGVLFVQIGCYIGFSEKDNRNYRRDDAYFHICRIMRNVLVNDFLNTHQRRFYPLFENILQKADDDTINRCNDLFHFTNDEIQTLTKQTYL